MSGKSPKTVQPQSALSSTIDFYRLLNAVPLGALILDRRRRVLFCNHALEAIVGITAAAAQGLACRHVMRSRACLTECPAAKGSLSENVCFETDLINRDRKRIPIRCTLAPIFDSEGHPAGFIETVEDLRPLKEHGEKISRAYGFGNLVGQSRQMEKLFRIVPVIAQSDASVLITGETGTGKDIVAETLHQESERAKGPFVKINCGALPETLLESELFGHVKGAFTGASENKQGRFYLAHNGTLYLTEIGDLPLTLQVKLLTFLDDKIVFPLGATRGFAADVRVVAATHRDLERMVRDGRFRQDLFFRLNVLRLHIPPLREREGDVRLLLDHYLNFFTRKTHRSVTGFASKALSILLDYDYPGNVRELRNIIEYAVNVGREGKIQPKHLPAYLSEERESIRPALAASDEVASPPFEAVVEAAPTAGEGSWPVAERRLIMEALVKAKGNRQKAARQLGWARSTLWRKMKHYGMDQS
jgi:transcriptional regulator with PAS, ATPase and Fis domain